MKKTIEAGLVLVLLTSCPEVIAKRPITFEDLIKIQRISEPQVSPDGRWIAYVQGTVNFETNKIVRHIWLIPGEGGEPRQLSRGEGSDTRPRWSPDGQAIAFISTRGGKSQVWVIPVNGGEARQLTSLSTEADGETWAAKADELIFTSVVYPDCPDDACNQKRLEEAEKSKVKAQLIDRLFFRHWDHWLEGKYTHIFAVSLPARFDSAHPSTFARGPEPVEGQPGAKGGLPRDLTPGAFESPTWFLGAPDGYAISPDGTEVCYTSDHSGHPAWSTNNDLYLVSVDGGEARNITKDNPGSDASPQYSPNGRYIAYTSQARDGYESDLLRLRVYDRQSGRIKDVTPGFDQWVVSFAWAPDSDTLYFTAPEHARQPVFKTAASAPAVEKVLEGTNDEILVSPDGKWLIFTRSSLTQPPELFRAPTAGGAPVQLTHANDALLAELDMNGAESVMSHGALGAEIQSLLVKPPGFDPNKKYPAILLVHGGPQSAWDDAWGYRWNAQMFASHGYVVLMTNFHGSTGYGQKFVEEISGDWGGACYEDLMAAADYLESLPYVDKARIGAAGASFGGFMINWIAGHTNRFKALVSHDGVYDNRSMYGETEELWFDEWEFKGLPWDKTSAALREKWSPSNFMQFIQTPMLIVEGEQDFRVPLGQALQLFTSLQRRGVPSKLLYFPGEGHWVLKPQNSQLWYKTVLGWLDRYLKP
jgi:dipeptidyl aminopeptidase/acylaminoacyl peptidase